MRGHYNFCTMKIYEILPIKALGPLEEPIDMEKLVTSRDRQYLKTTSTEISQAVLRWPKREWQYVGRIAPPLTAHGRRVVEAYRLSNRRGVCEVRSGS